MDWTSIIPPLLAITIVLWKKEVISALVAALFASEFLLLLSSQSPWLMSPINTVERVVSVATSPGNARILIFSLAIGALLAFMRDSGGVAALVKKLVGSGVANTARKASGLTFITGVVVFVESNLSVLTSGIFARGLFDRFQMSRARLAYIIDSTSAPICILILLNGWGAFVLGLLDGYDLADSSVDVLWGSVGYNFYAITTLLLVIYTIYTGKVYGPMREADERVQSAAKSTGLLPNADDVDASQARFMVIPLLVLVLGMLGFMLWTGNGKLSEGSGSKSMLYATVLSMVVAYTMSVIAKKYDTRAFVSLSFKGMSELLPLVSIVLFSLCLGASLRELGTGLYVANLIDSHLPTLAVAPLLFLTGAIISFTTGTSWGTFAILIPIAVPLVESTGLPAEFLVAAVLGGGIFGDHCSPISDTTAVSALASGCDLLEHVKTQLPYALTAGGLTLLLYFVWGMFL